MANTLRIKRSSTATVTPTSLLEGELAANIIDKKIWIGSSSQVPVLISDISSSVPSQSGNSGKYLTTNGSTTSWASVSASPASSNIDGGVGNSIYLLTQNLDGGVASNSIAQIVSGGNALGV